MPADKRMLFLRNAESLKDDSVPRRSAEYQVVADARIVGELPFGPYVFSIWEISNRREGDGRWLCLRVQERMRDPSSMTADRFGFYHGGVIPSELVALASLFLRQRLRLGPIVRMDDSPRLLPEKHGWIDREIVSGESNFGELANWLARAERLKPDLHEPFVLCAKLYQQALELIESKPDLAYLNLVSAIEVLASRHDLEKPTLDEVYPDIAALTGRVQDDELRSGIEQKIVAKERLIKRKFVEFIVTHTDETFWSSGSRPQHGRVEPRQLKELMEKVYDQRSRTLHSGEPFPPNVFHPPLLDEEFPIGVEMSVGERKWLPEDLVPSPHFFERLVNHVLKNFLVRHSTE